MSDQQSLSVTYGSFSCEIIGFQDPLPVLQDVIGEFRQIAWRYPGFGAQKDDAQRDCLSRLVASKLNVALADNGVSITLNSETGGLLAQPVGGATEGEGWGDLYAKPKTGAPSKNSKVKHAAATTAEATEHQPVAEAPVEPEETPAPVAAPPRLEIVPSVEEPPTEIEDQAEELKIEEPPPEVVEDIPPPVEVKAAAIDESPSPAEVAPPEEIADVAAEVPAEKPAKNAETAREKISAKAPETADAPAIEEPAKTPASVDADTEEDADMIAARVREEFETIVNSEIKDAFAEFEGVKKPPEKPAEAPATKTTAEAAPKAPASTSAAKSGLFSRFLSGKKAASNSEASADPSDKLLNLTKSEAVAEPAKAKIAEAPDEDTRAANARPSGAVSASDSEKDFVFSEKKADKPTNDKALLLSSAEAVGSDEAAALEAEERVARAKAKVMERAKERQAAEHAATERRLRIIRRERVEEKGAEMTGAIANVAAGKPFMSAADFAKLTGAASLQELMEASAAYATLVGGKHKFTRNDLMEVMSELDKKKAYSHEALLKSFGKMLRTGVLLRVDDGLFAMSVNHRHPYEIKIHA